jgi:hypothetical protein
MRTAPPTKLSRSGVALALLLAAHPAFAAGDDVVRAAGTAPARAGQRVEILAKGSPVPPSAADHKRGFVVFQRSTLKRLTAKSTALSGEAGPKLRVEAAWDEREPVQLGVQALRDLHGVTVAASPLEDDKGNRIPASAVDVRLVRFYALKLSLRVNDRFGVVPKTLEPAVAIDVPAGTTRPWWITVHVPDGLAGGVYRGKLTVADRDARMELPLEVDVLPRRLDEATAMLGPWAVPVLRNLDDAKEKDAEKIRERADLAFRDIREHGMTSMGLLSGDTARTDADGRWTVPDLDAALELYRRHRFPKPLIYEPVNLLSTNKLRTSSNYRHYDPGVHVELAERLARDYTKRAADADLPGIVFAPVDEPNVADGIAFGDEPEARQDIAAQLLRAVRKAGGRTAMTCTPDSGRALAANLDYWMVAYKKFDPAVLPVIRRAGGRPGLYANSTLMGNGTSFSRFFFGYWPWSQRVDAMMAWTYPSQAKRFPENRDESGEGPLNLVDGYLGRDGRPVPVIQWELAREGVDDFRYLVTLENLVEGAKRQGGGDAKRTAAEAAAFLEKLRASISPDVHRYTFEDPKSLEPAPSEGWDDARFEETRRRSFELVKKLTAQLRSSKPGS